MGTEVSIAQVWSSCVFCVRTHPDASCCATCRFARRWLRARESERQSREAESHIMVCRHAHTLMQSAILHTPTVEHVYRQYQPSLLPCCELSPPVFLADLHVGTRAMNVNSKAQCIAHTFAPLHMRKITRQSEYRDGCAVVTDSSFQTCPQGLLSVQRVCMTLCTCHV